MPHPVQGEPVEDPAQRSLGRSDAVSIGDLPGHGCPERGDALHELASGVGTKPGDRRRLLTECCLRASVCSLIGSVLQRQQVTVRSERSGTRRPHVRCRDSASVDAARIDVSVYPLPRAYVARGGLDVRRWRRVVMPRAINRTTMPMGPMTLDATAIEPATLLVSAQISPMMVPTTKTATITASQYRIRRLLMTLRVLR